MDHHDPLTGEVIEPVINRDKPRMPIMAYIDKLFRKSQTIDGAEIPDSTPMAPPLGFIKQASMVDIMREQIRTELSRIATEQGFESLEESDDFYIAEDDDPSSPYEMEHDYEPISEFLSRMTAAEQAALQAGGVGGPARSPDPSPGPKDPPPRPPDSAST